MRNSQQVAELFAEKIHHRNGYRLSGSGKVLHQVRLVDSGRTAIFLAVFLGVASMRLLAFGTSRVTTALHRLASGTAIVHNGNSRSCIDDQKGKNQCCYVG